MRISHSLGLISSLLLLACGGHGKPPASPDEPSHVQGVAVLESRSGSNVTGEARFTDKGTDVELTITVAGAEPGLHGVHIHEKGDCSSPDAKSAGDHYNPTSMEHGAPGDMPHHAGDMGNLEVGADGTGTATITLPGVTLTPGDHSLAGRAIVVHAKEDDFRTQPSGNSGDRVACGVIKVGDEGAAH
jgi:Cu-Zn family superoxide dismutase